MIEYQLTFQEQGGNQNDDNNTAIPHFSLIKSTTLFQKFLSEIYISPRPLIFLNVQPIEGFLMLKILINNYGMTYDDNIHNFVDIICQVTLQ